jgi:hypothetical protein
MDLRRLRLLLALAKLEDGDDQKDAKNERIGARPVTAAGTQPLWRHGKREPAWPLAWFRWPARNRRRARTRIRRRRSSCSAGGEHSGFRRRSGDRGFGPRRRLLECARYSAGRGWTGAMVEPLRRLTYPWSWRVLQAIESCCRPDGFRRYTIRPVMEMNSRARNIVNARLTVSLESPR